MTRRLQPCVIRMYDEAETRHQIKRVLGIEKDGAYLVFGFDGYEEIVDIQVRIATEMFRRTAVEDLGSEMGENWWKNKYKFYFPPYIMDIPEAFGTMDTVATYDKVETIYRPDEGECRKLPGTRFIAHFSHWYDWGCMMRPVHRAPRSRPRRPRGGDPAVQQDLVHVHPHRPRLRGGPRTTPRRPEDRLPHAGAVRPCVPRHPGDEEPARPERHHESRQDGAVGAHHAHHDRTEDDRRVQVLLHVPARLHGRTGARRRGAVPAVKGAGALDDPPRLPAVLR